MVEKLKIICLLIIGLPLLGFVINGLGFKKIPKALAGLIGIFTVLSSFALSTYLYFIFVDYGGKMPLAAEAYNWIKVGDFEIDFSFYVDQLTLLMLGIITGVGTLIHLYSTGYMKHDEGFGKFFAFLNLFIFFMLILVMGGNYVVMFIGWEGVGLCSYLLIGFWNTNTNYGDAARKAFIMNRIGDLGFLIGIFLIFLNFGTVHFDTVFEAASHIKVGDPAIKWITICLFIGAMGKSAQIPLYTWLPDAMAGPTPVSALIHAATMVTAGIYMVVRSNLLYSLAPDTLELIAITGIATALFAATIGILQNDIKKVLAYSTVSQLGYMFLALGVGAYTSGIFHVMTHAFFKALLFLGAGSVIHAMSDEQDIRYMGGLWSKIKITSFTFLIGTIAITGILPFAGFFSKDDILSHVYEHSKILWALGVLGAMMTSFYMFRLFFVTFTGKFRGTHEQEHHLHESPSSMTIPLLVLAVLSIIGGFAGLPQVLSKTNRITTFLSPVFDYAREANPELFADGGMSHSTEWMLMGVSVAGVFISFIAAYILYVNKKAVPAKEETGGISKLIYNKYYIDEIYDFVFVKPTMALSRIFYGTVEKLVDFVVDGTGRLVVSLSGVLRLTQTGTTGFYIFIMVFGIGLILLLNYIF